MMNLFKSFVCCIFAVTLLGCGAAHVNTKIHSENLKNYKNVYLSKVNVYSLESSAKDNAKLQAKLKNWQRFSKHQLTQTLQKNGYKISQSMDTSNPQLLADLDINVKYGNRALRWLVGEFGAGKGRVHSILKLKDARTKTVVYHIESESDLRVGGAGGDMEKVLKNNIYKLMAEYKKQHNL
ncbi:hypothetical protein D5018_06205 [Parashewanella curva]|uniref:DUF4410 domain-containing protein n=1 Tax=Parashewanella curva TaxID=2338552 RepID=A0A3L8PYK6_9GAMM|nr:BREX system ATP-binding domain-containing protein [Parashewanella curva]RLV60537.1 hypothetical protein D5018_06205 [Parashewanella curva]